MNIIDALVNVLGEFPAEYEFLLYAAAIIFFVLFMHWTFGLFSRLLLDYLLGGGKRHG